MAATSLSWAHAKLAVFLGATTIATLVAMGGMARGQVRPPWIAGWIAG